MGRRPTSQFVCQECGARSPGWLGRCPECGGWDSLIEEIQATEASARGNRSAMAETLELSRIREEDLRRLPTGMVVLDRVLGGGLVPGSAVLLSGEPGIGKSTLLLQLADGLGKAARRVLYFSAEESGRQLRLRADRLGCEPEGLAVVADTTWSRSWRSWPGKPSRLFWWIRYKLSGARVFRVLPAPSARCAMWPISW